MLFLKKKERKKGKKGGRVEVFMAYYFRRTSQCLSYVDILCVCVCRGILFYKTVSKKNNKNFMNF